MVSLRKSEGNTTLTVYNNNNKTNEQMQKNLLLGNIWIDINKKHVITCCKKHRNDRLRKCTVLQKKK
jgi:hypothetical protein